MIQRAGINISSPLLKFPIYNSVVNIQQFILSSITWITGVVMVFSAFGLIIPIYPGGVIIWIAAIFYGLVVGLDTWGWISLIIISILGITSSLVDNVLVEHFCGLWDRLDRFSFPDAFCRVVRRASGCIRG
jgi:hypothetical protein